MRADGEKRSFATASAFAGSLSFRAMKVVQIVARCTDVAFA